jgi:Glycosyltransferases involved in cell wall biogenesis
MDGIDEGLESVNLLVSVIVPIYNVEAYLQRCVDSILSQTYKNLEIILVDDGSPDECPAICDEYANKDRRVQVIHKKNGGLSDARNAGLKIITGDYLMFVDSDDWLEKTAISDLYKLIVRSNAQLAIGGMQRIEDGTEHILKSDFSGETRERCFTKTQAMEDLFRNGCAAWARLFLREIHNGIFFPVGEINEDEAIMLSILNRCTTVAQTNLVVYNYRCRPDSITTTSFSKKKLIWYKHCNDNLKWIRKHYPELELCAAKRLCVSVLWSLTEIALCDSYEPIWVSELQNCLKENYKLFRNVYQEGVKQDIRLIFLRRLPFSVYRNLIRLKRIGII